MRRFAPLLGLLGAVVLAAAPPATAERVLDRIEAERVEPEPPLRPLPRWTAPGRPRVALALSGGGSRALAHVGVLLGLEEEGIEIDGIAGSSAGALVGGLRAAGYAPEEIADLIRGGRLGELLSGLDRRQRTLSRNEDLARSSAQLRLRRRRGGGTDEEQPGGLLAARDLDQELQRLLLLAQAASGGDFDRLALRFRPVATDLVSGHKLAPESGDLAPLLTGSATVPGLMAPIAYGDALLVDGGLRENVPVETARTLGTEVVIAVNVSQVVDEDRRPANALEALDRSLDIVMDAKTQESLGRADAVLAPDVGFARRSALLPAFDALIESGRAAVAEERGSLLEVLKDLAPDRRMLAVDAIEVAGSAELDAERLGRRLGLGEAAGIPRWRIASELARLLNRGAVSEAHAELLEREGRRVLRVIASPVEAPTSIRVVGPSPAARPGELASPAWCSVRASAWPLRLQALQDGDPFAHLSSAERGDELVLHWSRWSVVSAATRSEDPKLDRASRRIAALTEERFDYDRLAFRLDELGSRGLVRRWRLNVAREGPEELSLVAELEPDRPDELGLGGAYRGDLGWAGLLRLRRANLRGSGEELVLTLAGGEEKRIAELAWQGPFGFGLRTTGWELGAGWRSGTVPEVDEAQDYRDREADAYESDRVWAGLVHRPGRRSLQAGLMHERRLLPAPSGGFGDEDERTSLYLHYSVDGQDRLLFPTRGGRLELRGEAAIEGDRLWKVETRGGWALPLDEDGATVLAARGGAGVSGQAEHRSYWFEPGGYAALYGWVPHGARAVQYLRGGLVLRRRLLARRGFSLHAELGADWLRRADDRDDLDEGEDALGWGLSVTASLPWLGPLSLGWSGNDSGADIYWITAGFPFLDD